MNKIEIFLQQSRWLERLRVTRLHKKFPTLNELKGTSSYLHNPRLMLTETTEQLRITFNLRFKTSLLAITWPLT
jgi:hypothetical protein